MELDWVLRNPHKSTCTRIYKPEESSAAVCAAVMSTVSAETLGFFKTSSCHKKRKGWLGDLVVFYSWETSSFSNVPASLLQNGVPLLSMTRGWSRFSQAYWLILQRLCWKTNACIAIGIVGSRAISRCIHVLRSGLWTLLACCTVYALIRCICHNGVQLQQL